MQNLIPEAAEVASIVLKKEPSLLQAQLLVLQNLFEQAAGGKLEALAGARKTALENAWAVHLPRKRAHGLGPTYDLAHFWFGDDNA